MHNKIIFLSKLPPPVHQILDKFQGFIWGGGKGDVCLPLVNSRLPLNI